jgi:hypothetical protein
MRSGVEATREISRLNWSIRVVRAQQLGLLSDPE